ncbi:P2X purinoceptor 4-like [Saccostrea echinata]|uniref:P2X purinoceptor 4-like n=1 Tax=Saccostrea echinata TaxID=191078 RepID=UPI002A825D55|nr:P2X purinoceptor 4-like [Saccostrea echinata]
MKYIRAAIGVFFEYDTPRIVHIKSKKVGVINRFIQLCIIGYVIGYAIIFKKGYQDFDNVQSVVTTKVKGIVMVDESIHPDIQRIWDVADYIVPPQENNAFFVVTNLIVTPFQSIGKCPEDSSIKGSNCTSDTDCKNGTVLPVGNGVLTGKCDTDVNTCEITAWCPVENGTLKAPKPAILENSKDFTVFIKNNIEFPKYNVKRRNLPDNVSDEYLQNCRYDGGPNSRCPIFTLQSIVEGANSGSYRDIAVEGGVIQVKIKWNCNLDLSVDECLPEYSFRRLDSSTYKISKGYNFRYSKNFKFENGTEYRTLYKAYGIKFVISVSGQGRKFAPVPFFTNIGSGLALLSIATVICDIAVLYILKARHLYKEKKYLQVVGDDAYKGLVNEDERSMPNYQATSDNDL